MSEKPNHLRDITGSSAAFDGIICIGGEDWWYHNRGHFDFQIMRRLAKTWPVLFVNSLGVRVPSLSDKRIFAQKIARKMQSLGRGIKHVENDFWVYSPFSVPGQTGQLLSNWALGAQIKLASRRTGMKNPLLWVHCPAGAGLVDQLNPRFTVLQRTDRFESFPEGDPDLLGQQISSLKKMADLVVYAAPHLMAEERDQVRSSLLITHGVDVETFVAAGDGGAQMPDDIKALERAWLRKHPGQPRPKRVGFIGGLDAHTFDPELFLKVASELSGLQFVLVGGSSLPEDWCTLSNVAMLGRKPYDEIAAYMAQMDVLIMPWNQSDWIKACNPIKLKEYLAVGRPVVTRDFAALEPWRAFVSVAEDAPSFARAIVNATQGQFDAQRTRDAVSNESWDEKARLVALALQSIGHASEAPFESASLVDAA